jgi:hypothetical protein
VNLFASRLFYFIEFFAFNNCQLTFFVVERAFEAFAIYEKELSIVCDTEAVPVPLNDINVGYFGYIKLDSNNTWRRVEVVDINR